MNEVPKSGSRKARIKLLGARREHFRVALTDIGTGMTPIARPIAEQMGVEYTGRAISFASVSGQTATSPGAAVAGLEIKGGVLKYEAVRDHGDAGEGKGCTKGTRR